MHERGADYEQFKAQLTKHLLDVLYETVPQVRGKVEYYHLGKFNLHLYRFCLKLYHALPLSINHD